MKNNIQKKIKIYLKIRKKIYIYNIKILKTKF